MSTTRIALATAAAALTAIALTSGVSTAATLAALQDGKMIVWIDTEKRMVIGKAELAGGARLVGIDVRPADSRLYGLTADGTIVTVDAKTGKWEKKSQLTEKLPAGASIAVDFNPVADRMRIIASNGISLRVNVEDGKATVDGALKNAHADANKGRMPGVTAIGYSNSVAGSKETTLYDIDAAAGVLVRQVPPNDGTLNTIGALGVKLDGSLAFDVWSDGKGMNVGWLLAGGLLHSVDLATGKATSVGAISGLDGRISDIAILPAM